MSIYLNLKDKFRWAGRDLTYVDKYQEIIAKGGWAAFVTKKTPYFQNAFDGAAVKAAGVTLKGKFTPHHIIPLELARGSTVNGLALAPMMTALIKKGYFSVTDGWNNLIYLPRRQSPRRQSVTVYQFPVPAGRRCHAPAAAASELSSAYLPRSGPAERRWLSR